MNKHLMRIIGIMLLITTNAGCAARDTNTNDDRQSLMPSNISHDSSEQQSSNNGIDNSRHIVQERSIKEELKQSYYSTSSDSGYDYPLPAVSQSAEETARLVEESVVDYSLEESLDDEWSIDTYSNAASQEDGNSYYEQDSYDGSSVAEVSHDSSVENSSERQTSENQDSPKSGNELSDTSEHNLVYNASLWAITRQLCTTSDGYTIDRDIYIKVLSIDANNNVCVIQWYDDETSVKLDDIAVFEVPVDREYDILMRRTAGVITAR